MNDEYERDAFHDPKQPPLLQSLDLGALGVSGAGEADALACDIDDPNCEVPGADGEQLAASEREESSDGAALPQGV